MSIHLSQLVVGRTSDVLKSARITCAQECRRLAETLKANGMSAVVLMQCSFGVDMFIVQACVRALFLNL